MYIWNTLENGERECDTLEKYRILCRVWKSVTLLKNIQEYGILLRIIWNQSMEYCRELFGTIRLKKKILETFILWSSYL